jgi:aminopeptidase-like protein
MMKMGHEKNQKRVLNSNPSEIEHYFDRLWPICRSITGDGLRESFKILKEIIPLELHEVESGKEVLDWTVPEEWNIRDAYILTPAGEKIADFKKNNLHVVNYSTPVDRGINFEELEHRLHYKEELPDAVPYITTYYKKRWGFCVDYNTYKKLPREGTYRVKIDSSLEKGSLTYGDLVLPGETDDEILFSSYLCHPSMANNELSGPLTLAFLYRELAKMENRKYSYRFVIAPETIGAICYLHQNKDELMANVRAGFLFTCCGDNGNLTYKSTRDENSITNRVVHHILENSRQEYSVLPFDPIGSDERQYASPGFNFQIGVIMRTPFSQFPEYHTSLDNKDLMNFDKMSELIKTVCDFVKAFEINSDYENQVKFGEPFLGKRDLFEDQNTNRSPSEAIKLRLRLLNFLDGTRDLLSVCDRYGYSILEIESEINQLLKHGLISDPRH